MPPPPPTKQPKRRLTVLNSPSEEADPNRRPWQWVGFGTLAIFTVWIPLAAIAGAIAARLPVRADDGPGATWARLGPGLAAVGLYAAALAVGAVLGGFLVGRWGTPGVGVREAALAGLGAAVVAAGITWASFGPSAGSLLVVVVSAPLAALGGRVGLRARSRRA
jgi:hypothetical protein